MSIIWEGVISPACAQGKFTPKYLREDNKAFRKFTRYTSENGFILFRKDTVGVNPETFFDQFGSTLGLNKHYRFKAVKDETDEKQIRHRRYQLFFKNIPVEGVEYLLHSKGNRMESANGRIVEDLDIDIDKPMSEKQALDYALADQKLTADAFKGKDKLPKGDLVIAATSTEAVKENFRLCYAFNMAPETATESYRIFVDATSGVIVRRLPLFANCFGMHNKPHAHWMTPKLPDAKPVPTAAAKPALIAATFIPNYARYLNGQAAITFETQQVGNQDPGNTVNMLAIQNTTLNTRIDVFNNGLWANNANVQRTGLAWGNEVPNATTAHWLTQRMYQYYQTKHGRNGIDGNGTYPRVLVDWTDANAQWNSPNSTIRFGNLPGGASLVTADVLGHEYAHAVDEFTSNLIYEGESGAIDESIADIMGTALERHVLPNNWNWESGDDFGTIRSLANPTLFGQPDNYANRAPINPPCIGNRHPNPPGGNDFCEVHTNSGIMNHWFFRIANQNSNTFIGFDEAADLVYKTQRYYLYSTSNYNDVRDATWAMAGSTYGTCSDTQKKVAAAWRAVGLHIVDCPPGCDYTLNTIAISGNTGCNQQITLTTNCNGAYAESCDGVTYNWSGPNVVSNGSNTATATLPSTGGSQFYFVSGLKSNCIPGSFRAALVEVNCGQACNPIASGNCYNIKVQKNGLRLQVMGDGTIQQQGANNQNNQIWKAEDTGGSQFRFTTQDGTNRVITSTSGNFGEWLSLNTYSGLAGQKWYTQCNANSHYRIYRDNGSTWDMKDFGNSPQLQLYGNTGEPFYDYRSFEFQSATCPTGTPPPPPPPSGSFAVVAPAYNCQTGALTMQTSGGNGSTIEYQIPGLRGWDTNPNFTVPSWQLNGTAFTLQARQSGTQAPDYQYATACGGTPPPPPPSGALTITAPNLDCPSGNLTLNTTGGNGSTIEYQISGLQGWTTSNVMNIPTWQRNGTAFTIQARQSGVEANPFVFTSGCANYRLASVSKTEPEQTLLVLPNPTTGRVTVRFRLVAGQAATLRTTNSRGSEVNRRAVVGTGQEQEETLNLDREVPGLYLLTLQSGSKRQTGKVVLQK